MMIKNYKFWALIAVLSLVVTAFFASQSSADARFFADENGFYLEIFTIFPDYINNFILSEPRITDMKIIDGKITQYKIINEDAYYELQNEGIIDYINSLERVNIWNTDHSYNYPDGQPSPLCLKDAVTHNMNGIYTANNQLIVNPNDERCPT